MYKKYIGISLIMAGTLTVGCSSSDSKETGNGGATEEATSLVEVLRTEGFTDMLAALGSTEPPLTDALAGDNAGLGWTVFAPSNEAFAAVDLTAMTPSEIGSLLRYHISVATFTAADLASATNVGGFDNSAGRLDMFNDQTVEITANGGEFQINGITVQRLGIDANNGVIHGIDTVLTPPAQ